MNISWEDFRKHIPLFCILLVAIALRLFKISEFQFDSDELSAIFRAQNAATWKEHIQNGVLVDGHPAGVQTFLWFWVKHISTSPLPLKFITSIFGLLNIVLIYAISRKIFNKKSALFASLATATLWWQIDLSLWVRPYIFGQFFVLLALQMLYSELNNSKKWLMLAASIAGTFYVHHFAFLTVMVCVSAIFILHQTKRHAILKALGIFTLLAIPQISIFTAQLKIGGLDWLGKPSPDFFWNHLLFIFNHSILGLSLIFIMVVVGFYYSAKTSIYSNLKTAILFLILWFVPMLIGYVYSLLFKPVLQNNVLFFSYPLFVMGIGYFFQNLPKWLFWSFQFAFLTLFLFQLGFTKKRYSVEINEVYFKQIEKLNSVNPTFTLSMIDGPMDVFLYHQKNVNPSHNALRNENVWNISEGFSYQKLFEIIENKESKYKQLLLLTNSGTRPEIRPLLYYQLNGQYVPQNFIGGQIDNFIFRNSQQKSDFLSKSSDHSPLKLLKSLTLQNNECAFLEFGKNINRNDLYFIALDHFDTTKKLSIVTAIVNNRVNGKTSEQIDWRSSSCNEYWKAGFKNAYHAVKLSDIPLWNTESQIRIGIEGEVTSTDSYKINVYQFIGNPYQYGIY